LGSFISLTCDPLTDWTKQCQRCYRIQWSGSGDREGLSQDVFLVHTPHSPLAPARLRRPGRQQYAQSVPRLHLHPVFDLVPYPNRAASPPSTVGETPSPL